MNVKTTKPHILVYLSNMINSLPEGGIYALKQIAIVAGILPDISERFTREIADETASFIAKMTNYPQNPDPSVYHKHPFPKCCYLSLTGDMKFSTFMEKRYKEKDFLPYLRTIDVANLGAVNKLSKQLNRLNNFDDTKLVKSVSVTWSKEGVPTKKITWSKKPRYYR